MAMPLALVWDLIATDNASAVFKRVGASAGAASKETASMGHSFAKAGEIVTLAAIGIGVVAVKMAMSMQESNAKIQGNAQITAKAATAIGDAFLGTAGKSTFSGKKMADAFGPVAGVIQALSGHTLTTADSMTVMAAATTLAEASGTSLDITTASLAAVMQNYGLKVKDAADASNVLFNTSRLTNIPLDVLTSTVDKLHGKLGIASPALADTSALMVDLANHGISGSKGVLVVNAGLTTLLGGSKATNAELKHLGVSVFDVHGKFVGMKGVLEQLTPKLKDMTDQQRLAAEKSLFGALAAKALNSTIMAGVDTFNKSTAAVTKHGAAEDAAKAAANTLHGQMKTLRATFADFMVLVGEKVIPVLQKSVDWMKQHGEIVKIVAMAIGGVLLVAIGAYTVSMIAAAAATIAATWPILLIVAAVAALAVGLAYAYEKSQTFRDIVSVAFHYVKTAGLTMALALVTGFQWLVDVWMAVAKRIVDGAATAFGWIPGIGPKLKDAAAAFDGMKDNVNASLDKIKKSITVDLNTENAKGQADAMSRYYRDQNWIAKASLSVVQSGIANKMAASGSVGTRGNRAASGMGFGHNALGTDNWRGGPTWVNEKGGEIIDLPSGSRVIPADKSAAMMGNNTWNIYEATSAMATAMQVSRRQAALGAV
jgi:TP901 family phage tail tape measure protein